MTAKVAHLRPRRPNRRQRVAAAVPHLVVQSDVPTRAARFAAALEQESVRWGLTPRQPAR